MSNSLSQMHMPVQDLQRSLSEHNSAHEFLFGRLWNCEMKQNIYILYIF